MDCSLPGSSVHGILQARTLEWVAISFTRGSSQLRDRTQVFYIAGRFFTHWATLHMPLPNSADMGDLSSQYPKCISIPVALVQFSSVQSLSHVRLFATPWIAARQASLSITNFRCSPKLISIKSVMPSRHLILCHPLLLLPPIPPSIRVFSSEFRLAQFLLGLILSLMIVSWMSLNFFFYILIRVLLL